MRELSESDTIDWTLLSITVTLEISVFLQPYKKAQHSKTFGKFLIVIYILYK